MVIRLIRWLRGYVVFTFSGAFPERFINMINARGIRNWDFAPDGDRYTGKIPLSDYLRIRPVARRAKVRLRSRHRSGLPFVLKKYRKRRGLLFGAAAGLALLVVLNQFVWDVRIEGAQTLSQSEIYSALESSGLKVGTLKKDLNPQGVGRGVQLAIPEIRWISVNAVNNIATVEIKEKARKPKVENISTPCNIVASHDGVITDIKTKSGSCLVKKGSAVARNSLLVSAVIEMKDKSLRYVHSDAEIFADVKQNVELKIPKKNNVIIPTGIFREKTSLSFLFLKIPLGVAGYAGKLGADVFVTKKLCFGGTALPVGSLTQRTYYYEEKSQRLSKAQAEKILKTRLALYECFHEAQSEVKVRSYSIKEDSSGYTLRAEYVFNKNIALKRKLMVEE